MTRPEFDGGHVPTAKGVRTFWASQEGNLGVARLWQTAIFSCPVGYAERECTDRRALLLRLRSCDSLRCSQGWIMVGLLEAEPCCSLTHSIRKGQGDSSHGKGDRILRTDKLPDTVESGMAAMRKGGRVLPPDKEIRLAAISP